MRRRPRIDSSSHKLTGTRARAQKLRENGGTRSARYHAGGDRDRYNHRDAPFLHADQELSLSPLLTDFNVVSFAGRSPVARSSSGRRRRSFVAW
jgi:hypothetical protein